MYIIYVYVSYMCIYIYTHIYIYIYIHILVYIWARPNTPTNTSRHGGLIFRSNGKPEAPNNNSTHAYPQLQHDPRTPQPKHVK